MLFVNADTREGEVRVEVLPERGAAAARGPADLQAFSLTRCSPITGDGVRQPVAWRGAPSLAPMQGKPIRLRFVLRKARLYSFWTE